MLCNHHTYIISNSLGSFSIYRCTNSTLAFSCTLTFRELRSFLASLAYYSFLCLGLDYLRLSFVMHTCHSILIEYSIVNISTLVVPILVLLQVRTKCGKNALSCIRLGLLLEHQNTCTKRISSVDSSFFECNGL